MSYMRFTVMVAISAVVMFCLMYLNTYVFSHIEYSQTRAWMAVLMGAAMGILMMGFMWKMYPSGKANAGIILVSVLIFVVALWLVRSQETVDDVSYMRAMIPHHSIAIMTSERAHIKDPEVRKIADRIIDAQIREIAEMKREISRLEENPVPAGMPDIPSYRDKHVPPPAPETDKEAGIDTLTDIH